MKRILKILVSVTISVLSFGICCLVGFLLQNHPLSSYIPFDPIIISIVVSIIIGLFFYLFFSDFFVKKILHLEKKQKTSL